MGARDESRGPPMKNELELNRTHWDEATRLHLRGDLYGVGKFKAGACRLHRVEVEEVV